MYAQIIGGHLAAGFAEEVSGLAGRLVDATIQLHRHVMNNFLPRWAAQGVGSRIMCTHAHVIALLMVLGKW